MEVQGEWMMTARECVESGGCGDGGWKVYGVIKRDKRLNQCIESERLVNGCSGNGMHVHGGFLFMYLCFVSYIQQKQDWITALGCKSSTKMAEGSFIVRLRGKTSCLK